MSLGGCGGCGCGCGCGVGEFLGGWGAGLGLSEPEPVPVLVDFAASLFNPGVSLRASRTNGKKVIPPGDL